MLKKGVKYLEKISIKTKYDMDTVGSILENKLSFLKDEINIDIEKKRQNKINIIEYMVNKTQLKEIKDVFNVHLANAILDVILNVYQMNIIEKITAQKFYYLDIKDVQNIKRNTIEELNSGCYIQIESLYRESINNKILVEIMEYLKRNSSLDIEGFINFRLKFYMDHIESIIRKNVEDITLEREYEEFIDILQHFIEIQEPQMDLVNVVMDDERYKLIDQNNNLINSEYLEDIANELSDIDITYDDLLISSLITIAPKEVIIHTNKEQSKKEVVNIIKSVFKDKVTIYNTSK